MGFMDIVSSLLNPAGQGPAAPTRAPQQASREVHHVAPDPAAAEARRNSAENLADPVISTEFKQAVLAAHDPKADPLKRIEEKVDLLSRDFHEITQTLGNFINSVLPLIMPLFSLGGSPEAAAAKPTTGQTNPTAQSANKSADELDPATIQMLLKMMEGGVASEAGQRAADITNPNGVVAETKSYPTPAEVIKSMQMGGNPQQQVLAKQ